MPLRSIELATLQRRNLAEWVATMQAEGDGEPSSFYRERIVESFGLPQIYNGMISDGDLNPATVAQHRGSAANVLRQITPGRPGTFTVDRNGRFEDFHGGPGFTNRDWGGWFTREALDRGIAWFFQQSYRHGTRIVGRYKVIRTISNGEGLVVRKVQLRI